jgi:heme/copper-type cytochrome/quinol oxidase subunit 3
VTTLTEDPLGHGRDVEHVAGHHETREQRHFKEHLAVWLFISGDAVFLLMELFYWFYLRALNTDGMWRGATCSKASPCTDGLGNPITHEIARANPWYTITIALLTVVAAGLVWTVERSAQRQLRRRAISGGAAVGLVVVLAAIALQCYQFGVLPFTTIDGTYASTFEFLMGSTLAHLSLLAFIVLGLWTRSRLGRYDEGRWYQVRIIRIFAVWLATSTCILAIVMSAFS